MFRKIVLIFTLILLAVLTKPIFAQEETMEGQITSISDQKIIEVMDQKQLYQKLTLQITKGNESGKTIVVENGNLPLANIVEYHLHDKVTVQKVVDPEGNSQYQINDFVRRDNLLLLFIIFIVLTTLIARWKGFSAVISMICTFFVIFKFTLPQLSNGANPLLISVVTIIIIVPITFYLSHGFNKKTTVAIISTMITLFIISLLSIIFIKICYLTGLSSEDAATLSLYKPGVLNMKDLLFAGFIIGALGILDDITVAQASVVNEIKTTMPKIKTWDLYKKGMNVGRDHITSMVNTLVLAYAGASLPLLLIFVDNPRPFSEVINYEFIAEEIVRTLVGSIGLIIAVPITTIIAVLLT